MKKWKKVIGLTVVSSLLLATSAFAGATYQKISAELRPDIKIISNGTTQSFKDANGTAISPITYNGTVYLPVRGVSTVFNSPITWDSKSLSVIIGTESTGNIPAGAAKSVIAMPDKVSGYAADKIVDVKELTFKYGDLQENKTFANAIRIKGVNSAKQSGTIKLDGKYATISGTLHNSSSSESAVILEIRDNDTDIVLLSQTLEPGTFYTYTDVSLNGAKSLHFVGQGKAGTSSTIYFLEPTVK